MIEIDKTDDLYAYLTALGVQDVETEYTILAPNGRVNKEDIREYYKDIFRGSTVNDTDEKDLIKLLDYYVDIKNIHEMTNAEEKQCLNQYFETKDKHLREKIINSRLKRSMIMCLNYLSLHQNYDIEDIIQTASLGLMQAVDKYHPNKILTFDDYVIYWTRENILYVYEEKNND